VHLIGFTIEICYDARPYERQIYPNTFHQAHLQLYIRCQYSGTSVGFITICNKFVYILAKSSGYLPCERAVIFA